MVFYVDRVTFGVDALVSVGIGRRVCRLMFLLLGNCLFVLRLFCFGGFVGVLLVVCLVFWGLFIGLLVYFFCFCWFGFSLLRGCAEPESSNNDSNMVKV